MITLEEVKKLFALARVEATAEELRRLPKEISDILAYIDKLKSASLGELPPTLSFAPTLEELRADEVVSQDAGDNQILKSQFPESSDDYLKTKKVFGE